MSPVLKIGIVCLLLVTLLSVLSLSADVMMSEWSLQKRCVGYRPLSPEMNARSLIDCASHCSRLPNCIRFCFSRTSGRCYIKNKLTPAVLGFNENGRDLDNIICSDRGWCPFSLGYSVVRGTCVKVYKEALEYLDAKARCMQEGAHLYHYRNVDKDLQVISAACSSASVSAYRLWVGADDLEEESRILWTDGCLLRNDFKLWSTGEPTNDPKHTENCVEVYGDVGLFNDNGCNVMHPFVCQFD